MFIIESPHSLAYFWLVMAKAEPWEKHCKGVDTNYGSLYAFANHNLQRKENKDIADLYNKMDPKRRRRYMQILSDALPKDINPHELEHQECAIVSQEWLDGFEADVARAAAARAAARAAGAAAPAAGDVYADSDYD